LHEVLSADVGFAIGDIGDAIDEPIIVPDIIRGKRTTFVNPRVFIINVFISHLIITSQIYVVNKKEGKNPLEL
jgi:hypothetical protein